MGSSSDLFSWPNARTLVRNPNLICADGLDFWQKCGMARTAQGGCGRDVLRFNHSVDPFHFIRIDLQLFSFSLSVYQSVHCCRIVHSYIFSPPTSRRLPIEGQDKAMNYTFSRVIFTSVRLHPMGR